MKKLITLFFASSAFLLNAQFANNWVVGGNFGINFSTSTPTLFTGGQITSTHTDNTSAISDATGNLLFYTDGSTVWNKNNTTMPNGTGLIGSYTGGQCALIVPIPCSSSKYVIFQVTDFANPGYLNYTVVDMSLNAGLGDVVIGQKNISLGSGWTEKLCAYYCNSTNSYWVVAHKWGSDQFVAYKVDASTIAATNVVSSIGSIHSCGTYGGVHDAMGQLTISPNGAKLVNALTCQDKFEIFDFNSVTGVISNSIAIPGNGGNAWGTAFSPDNTKLYVNSIFGMDIWQYDISSYTSAAINASKVSIYNTGTSGYNFGYMELGPNGKIYVPRPNTNFFSVVNTPNFAGAGCGFSYTGLSLGSLVSRWGTCRIAYNIPTSISGGLSIAANISNISCSGMVNGSATVVPTPAGSYNYLWTPGSYTNASVSGLAAGIYTVSVNNGPCMNTSTFVTITQPSPIALIITPSQFICTGNNAIVSSTVSGGTPAYSYSWSNGSTFSGINVSPALTKNFTLTITDANGCNMSAVTTVSVSDCTNIKESGTLFSGITVYPNPAGEIVSIRSSNTDIDEIVITNAIGMKVLSMAFEKERLISLKDLSEGIYFVQAFEKNKLVATTKIIKQ